VLQALQALGDAPPAETAQGSDDAASGSGEG